MISLILPEINMFYFPNLIKSINKIIAPLNYNLIISLTNNNSKTENELIEKCIYVINKAGMRIPDDISIITISDGVYPYLVNPNITHIKDSGSKLGKMAANTLLNMINKKNEKEIEKIYVGTRLVELNSVNNQLLSH